MIDDQQASTSRFTWKPLHSDVAIPALLYPGTSQYELRAYLLGTRCTIRAGQTIYERGPDTSEDVPFITIIGGELARIPLGIAASIPRGLEFQVRPLSDVSFESPVEIVDAPATIHAGFHGEWSVIVRNRGGWANLRIEHGMRIAQAVLSSTTPSEVVTNDSPR